MNRRLSFVGRTRDWYTHLGVADRRYSATSYFAQELHRVRDQCDVGADYASGFQCWTDSIVLVELFRGVIGRGRV